MTKEMKATITKELIEKLRKCITKIEVDRNEVTIGLSEAKWEYESMIVFDGYALDNEITDFYECLDMAFERIETEINFLLGGV